MRGPEKKSSINVSIPISAIRACPGFLTQRSKVCGEEATSTYQDAHRIAAELASAIEQLGTKEVKWEFLVLEVKRREPISGGWFLAF
jgi:hypothetical protein